MGRLIPAGTGLPEYRNLGIQVEVPEGFELETAPAGDVIEGEAGADVFGDVDAPRANPAVAGLFAGTVDTLPDGGSIES